VAGLDIIYRPNCFEQIVGHDETKNSLEKLLGKKNKPQTFLFHGPSGCGKTTFARIIGSILECNPIDFHEINASVDRGIDSIRDIVKKAKYYPVLGKVSIYLLDEAHQITGAAQNALLKILEDVPKHAVFILCTTEVNKIIPTVRSRCVIYDIPPLTKKETFFLLDTVSKKEKETVLQKEIKLKIYEMSEGMPRASLKLLEKIIDIKHTKESLSLLRIDQEKEGEIIDLARILVHSGKTWRDVCAVLCSLKKEDPEKIRRVILSYCSSILLNGSRQEKASVIMNNFSEPFYDTGFPGVVLACYESLFV